ncbi:uncharacterized protein LOC110454281 [Mizuhopecten yessoensis]|uniref:Contactin-associated protein like 5-3 n=1 Tax=Mizuhopecten yessoensis TaxID=6573 RepID=A0A210QFB9_MIZYE|nr:uncharacterized protein LOC110454281 [Mizuhopecten yessoensis]OWF47457.1 Contactin-associated protein like 5-3 [Mizuhopecten yessoensis]
MANVYDLFTNLMFVCLLMPLVVWAASADPLQVDYPSVIVHAKADGNFTMLSGFNGDIKLIPGVNNTGNVYFEGEDLLYLFEVILSQPPIWSEHSPFGHLGDFHGGERVFVQLEALDPEGGQVTYSVVAGDLPPGITLDSTLGQVKGLAPDADTTYSFTVRATDYQSKYADNVLQMKVRGIDSCTSTTCLHEGICQDTKNDFHCNCIHPYGGKTCSLDCRNNGLGVDGRHKVVPDAHMSAYKSYSTYLALNGRLYGSGWYGVDSQSWLQVDFGNVTQIHGVQIQGCSSYYYTTAFNLQFSVDGNSFTNYTTDGVSPKSFPGYGNTNSVYKSSLAQPVDARYVRFVPTNWNRSYKPCMRVELLGCYYL